MGEVECDSELFNRIWSFWGWFSLGVGLEGTTHWDM